jgi:two-component system, cell cycle sensor histidine kinase and response regulator CckA
MNIQKTSVGLSRRMRRWRGLFLETILIVDDEPTVLNLCRRILELGGYTVASARDGLEALRLLESSASRIDLALLDVIMPGMNGFELSRRVQSASPGTPIVFMSGFRPQEIAHIIGDLQPNQIIWKPFKTESLIRMVENALNRSGGAIGGK